MRFLLIAVIAVLNIAAGSALEARSLKAQNEAMFRELQQVHGLSDKQMDVIRKIFARSGIIGQGNPAKTRHPVSAQACRSRLEHQPLDYQNPYFEAICGAKFMAPLYDRSTEKVGDAAVCIDQFEFPDIPCAFPVVWVRPVKLLKFVRQWAKDSATLTNGRVPVSATWNRRIIGLNWPVSVIIALPSG